MNKKEYLAYLDKKAEDEDDWADKHWMDEDARIVHLAAAWAFRLARLKAEELDG